MNEIDLPSIRGDEGSDGKGGVAEKGEALEIRKAGFKNTLILSFFGFICVFYGASN